MDSCFCNDSCIDRERNRELVNAQLRIKELERDNIRARTDLEQKVLMINKESVLHQ